MRNTSTPLDKIKKYVMNANCICFFLFCSIGLSAQEYGLKFSSHDVPLEERTELNLSPEGFLHFQDEFEITFDLKIDFLNPSTIFGYVFRIINKENFNVDLLSTPSSANNLNLVIGKRDDVIPIETVSNILNRWINIRIKFLLSEDRMVLYAFDSLHVHDNIGFRTKDSFKIIFGANDYNQFKTTDVPSQSIRNIKLYEKGKLKYHWPLDEKYGNIAKDRIKGKTAQIKNPNWLMLSHQIWQSVLQESLDGYVIPVTDYENEIIYFLGNKSYYIFSIENQSLSTNRYNKDSILISPNYRAIFNSNDGKIYCYIMDSGQSISTFNPTTGAWENLGEIQELETRYRHHNSYYYPQNNSAYLFGGYGFHTYNNDVVQLDFNENKLQLTKKDSLYSPRYLAGLAALNDTVYILGGYGSESGNQLINPHSYYDLIGFSLRDSSFFKIFEIPRLVDDMAVANSMWIDPETRSYYALIFEKSLSDGYLQLIKGNLNNPKLELRGNKIPFRFLDVRSFAGLFYAEKKNKLFAYTTYHDENDKTQISIHSISYPPDPFTEELADSTIASKNKMVIIIILATILITTLIIFIRRRKKNKSEQAELDSEKQAVDADVIETVNYKQEKINYQIIFFGGFQVYNKSYEDITNKFSPLLKELFLLLTLYTFKNNKGISSEKLTEILWFDKSEKSARNNRAVNIAKIRNILSEIGSCELTKKTGYWKIVPEANNIKSDYIDFLEITSSKTNLTKQKIIRLLEITDKGAFLYNVNYEWLDEFKASVSEKIIDTLINYANSCDITKEAEFVIHLADSVFNFDMVNEDAMMLKCRAEYSMGKHSLAKSTYEKFFKEYRAMYDQEYDQSFLKVLKIRD